MISDKKAIDLYVEAYPDDNYLVDAKDGEETIINDVKQIIECSSKEEALALLDEWNYAIPELLIDVLTKHNLVLWNGPINTDERFNPYGWKREDIIEGVTPHMDIIRETGDLRPLADYILSLVRIAVEKSLY